MSHHLSRPIILHLFMDGTLVFRRLDDKSKETKKKIQGSLPVFSVDTEKEAEQIQVGLCRKAYGEDRYILPFSGQYEDVEKATEALAKFYELGKKGYKGADLYEPFKQYKEAIGLPAWA